MAKELVARFILLLALAVPAAARAQSLEPLPDCEHPERSAEENERWLQWWRSLAPDQQAKASASAPWALLDWLHWFAPGPDQRQWAWWRGAIESETKLSIVLVATGWPIAHGAFDWIVRAAGATPLEEEPVA